MNWETSKKPLVIAHRGDTRQAVENSLEAVEAAMKVGADGVEVDLRLTRDGKLVLFHDKTLKRLANQKGIIEKMSWEELQKIRIRNRRIPSLQDLLDLTKDKILLNLEIKTVPLFLNKVERELLSCLRNSGLESNILVSSFHPLALWRLRQLAPQIRRGYLVANQYFRTRYRPLVAGWLKPFSLHPSTEMVTQDLVTRSHAAGKRIFVWTVLTEDAKRYQEWGVDGLITDEPQTILETLGQLNGHQRNGFRG